MVDKVELTLLENLEKTINTEQWKENTMLAILKYRDDNNIDDNSPTDIFLDRMIWLLARNRSFEMKRWLKQELENTKGFTEQICKRRKIKDEYCKRCKNYNCNLNKNKEN